MKKKDIIQLCVTAVLAVILLILVVRGVTGTKKRPKRFKNKQEFLKEQIAADKEEKLPPKPSFFTLDEETRDLKVVRDPFSKVKAGTARGPYLSGISWDEENPQAVINGEIVGVGGQIAGNTVVDIQKDKVILNTGTDNFELRIGE